MLIQELQWFFQTYASLLQSGDKYAFQTLVALSLAHLFGFDTVKALTEELDIPAQPLYTRLKAMSLYSLQKLAVRFMVKLAAERLRPLQEKSAATRSRAGVTISGDDTVIERVGKTIRSTYRWYSGRAKQVVNGNDLMGLVLTINGEVLPLHLMFCSKQGRGTTSKPELLVKMLKELKELFAKEGIDITQYPLTLDSWFASEPLRQELLRLGFQKIIVAGKGHYVFTIDGEKDKAAGWKNKLELSDREWGVKGVPLNRVKANSPTFGNVALLFFRKKSTRVFYLLDFSQTPGRAAEIWRAWKLHHAVECFWKTFKSIFHLKSIVLRGDGLYAGLLVKVLAYLMVMRLKSQKDYADLSALQTLRKIRREECLGNILKEHFHDIFPSNP